MIAIVFKMLTHSTPQAHTDVPNQSPAHTHTFGTDNTLALVKKRMMSHEQARAIRRKRERKIVQYIKITARENELYTHDNTLHYYKYIARVHTANNSQPNWTEAAAAELSWKKIHSQIEAARKE